MILRPIDDLSWVTEVCSLPDLAWRLEDRRALAYQIGASRAAVVITFGKAKDSGAFALWIAGVGGKLGFRPKTNLRIINQVLVDVEAMARVMCCDEIRVDSGTRMDWKRNLLPLFGFVEKPLGEAFVMRRVL